MEVSQRQIIFAKSNKKNSRLDETTHLDRLFLGLFSHLQPSSLLALKSFKGQSFFLHDNLSLGGIRITRATDFTFEVVYLNCCEKHSGLV